MELSSLCKLQMPNSVDKASLIREAQLSRTSLRMTRIHNTDEVMTSLVARSKKSSMRQLQTWTRVEGRCHQRVILRTTTHSMQLRLLPARLEQLRWARDRESLLHCSNHANQSHRDSSNLRDSTSLSISCLESLRALQIYMSLMDRTRLTWRKRKAICSLSLGSTSNHLSHSHSSISISNNQLPNRETHR